MKTEKKEKLHVFRLFLKVSPIVIAASPALFLLFVFVSIGHGISWAAQIVAQQYFFDSATLLASSKTTFTDALFALGILGFSLILCQVLNGVGNFLPNVMIEKCHGVLKRSIHSKMARLSPIDFDNTDRLDDINKASKGSENATMFVGNITSITTFYLPYFAFLGWYLFTLKPILAAILIIIFVPTIFAQMIRTKLFAKLEDKSAPLRREYDYYESCMVSREYFKETRLLGAFGFFKRMYMDTLELMQALKFKASMKANLFELAMKLTAVLGYCLILWLLFTALMKQEISVGAFAAVFNSIDMLYSLVEEVICMHIGEMAEGIGMVSNFVNFLEMDERKGANSTEPGWGDITLDHVTFSYPNAQSLALKDVSFTLQKGETLAVVGENGSGKSTLIRLLCGLYLPDSGSVLHNGTEVSKLTMSALFARTSAVFQKYQRYQMSMRENISISKAGKDASEEILDQVCELSGIHKTDRSFLQGYDTMLSREFDGVDLSGGQWQRIAIARGFYRDHDLIILDEPTAAIDPYEETRIYNQFAEIARDKSAVIVTHRLGSVKLADRIVVMKNGEAVQIGTHDELIGQDGEYKRLYESQEQWYANTLEMQVQNA